jgi:hypothetical protein
VVPKLSQVLSQSQHKLRERDFTATCARCREVRSIAECKTDVQHELRSYRCSQCGTLLVLVGHPTDRPISGDDCRVGKWWSIRASTELFVTLGGTQLRIPSARRAALFGEPML